MPSTVLITIVESWDLNPIALRKAKLLYYFGLSECNRVNARRILYFAAFTVNGSQGAKNLAGFLMLFEAEDIFVLLYSQTSVIRTPIFRNHRIFRIWQSVPIFFAII